MIDFQFDVPPTMYEISGRKVQYMGTPVGMPIDMSWATDGKEILVRFVCTDGIYYIILDRDKRISE